MADDWSRREFSTRMASERQPVSHFWSLRACVFSWLMITLSFIVMVTGAVCLEELKKVADHVCVQPEIQAGLVDGQSCAEALECFGKCIDETNLITSSRMRDCFFGSLDRDDQLVMDSECTRQAATLAYGLAQRYIQPNVSAVRARRLMRVELGIAAPPPAPPPGQTVLPVMGRRLQTLRMSRLAQSNASTSEQGSPLAVDDGLASQQPLQAAQGSPLSVHRLELGLALRKSSDAPDAHGDALTPLSARDDGGLRVASVVALGSRLRPHADVATPSSGLGALIEQDPPVRRGPSDRMAAVRRLRALSPEDELDIAYTTLAVASSIALVGSEQLTYDYGWLVAVGVLSMLPGLLALYSLGNSPPRCCHVPRMAEKMHKGSMRCSCHLSWCIGVIVLFMTALLMAKFQLVVRFIVERQTVVPAAWGFGSVVSIMVPCIFGLFIGTLPVFFAMVISRTRAERRHAMASDAPIKRYKKDSRKELTAPRPVLRGDPPNPAMLNPVLEPTYVSNYPTDGVLGRSDSRIDFV